MTYLANITAQSNTAAWVTVMTEESPSAIRSIMLNNGTTNFVVVRRKSNTNVSAQFGTGTFNLPRVNPGDLEVQSASANSASILICCGCQEDPA
jgi:hypothetical protein